MLIFMIYMCIYIYITACVYIYYITAYIYIYYILYILYIYIYYIYICICLSCLSSTFMDRLRLTMVSSASPCPATRRPRSRRRHRRPGDSRPLTPRPGVWWSFSETPRVAWKIHVAKHEIIISITMLRQIIIPNHFYHENVAKLHGKSWYVWKCS